MRHIFAKDNYRHHETIVESPDSGSNATETAREGRVPTLVEQIENLMNSLIRQQENPSNSPIEQVKGIGAGNVDVPILFYNNSNEFQTLMQEIKRQRIIMTTFMEEMKQQSQFILENLRERGQPRLEVASKLERQFSNELGGQHYENLQEAGEIYCSPM